jgi:hypothetical protein
MRPYPDMDALEQPRTIAERVARATALLRHFAKVLSTSDYAAGLLDAAELIESLADIAERERRLACDVDARLTESIRSQTSARAEIGSVRAELSVLQRELAERRRMAAEAHEATFNEALEQSARADKAERLARETSDELQQLQDVIARIGHSSIVIPIVTLEALRTQVEFLSREFARIGDTTSVAMCEIAVCTIARSVVEGLKVSEGA